MDKKPALITGAIVGALLTAPLMALLYLVDQLAGLPFVPFDVLAPVRDVPPGNIIMTFIETMVDVIVKLNLGAWIPPKPSNNCRRWVWYALQFVAGGFSACSVTAFPLDRWFIAGATSASSAIISGEFRATAAPLDSALWIIFVFAL
jgi:hypothetical protein